MLQLLAALLVVSIAVQTVYYVRIQSLYPPYGLTTEHYYSPVALNLLHHGTYGVGEYPDVERSTKRPPLYSVVLAGAYGAFVEDERVGLILNNIFLWLSIVVAYLIGRSFSPAVGLLAALLFALDPVGVINANKNQAGALYGLLFGLFFLAALRAFTPSVTLKWCLAISALLGLATLTRANSLYLAFPLLVAFFVAHRWVIRRVPLKRLAVLMLALFSIQAVVIGAWMARNHTVTGNPDFTGMTVTHLYGFYVPLVIGKKEGLGYREARAKLYDELKVDEEYLAIEGVGARQRYVVAKSIRLILANPLQAGMVILEQMPVVFLNYPQDAASLFLGDERRDSVDEILSDYSSQKTSRLDISGYGDVFRHYVDNGLGLLLVHGIFYKLFYAGFMVAGAAGIVLMLFNRIDRAVGIAYLAVIAYMLLMMSTWPSGRLRMAILPMYSVAAAYGLVWGWGRLQQVSWSGISPSAFLRRRREPA